jgi:hypothetical protein
VLSVQDVTVKETTKWSQLQTNSWRPESMCTTGTATPAPTKRESAARPHQNQRT